MRNLRSQQNNLVHLITLHGKLNQCLFITTHGCMYTMDGTAYFARAVSYKHKMVMKSTTGIHFINLFFLSFDAVAKIRQTVFNYIFQFCLIFLSTGANVIKLICPTFTIFRTEIQYLLDQVGKACQGQTLLLITKIRKLRTKKFQNIGPSQCNNPTNEVTSYPNTRPN